jgi:hypothetical protein
MRGLAQLPIALPNCGILRLTAHFGNNGCGVVRYLAKPNAPLPRVVGRLAELAGMRHQRFRMMP